MCDFIYLVEKEMQHFYRVNFIDCQNDYCLKLLLFFSSCFDKELAEFRRGLANVLCLGGEFRFKCTCVKRLNRKCAFFTKRKDVLGV